MNRKRWWHKLEQGQAIIEYWHLLWLGLGLGLLIIVGLLWLVVVLLPAAA